MLSGDLGGWGRDSGNLGHVGRVHVARPATVPRAAPPITPHRSARRRSVVVAGGQHEDRVVLLDLRATPAVSGGRERSCDVDPTGLRRRDPRTRRYPGRVQTVMSTNVIRTDRWDRGVAAPRSVRDVCGCSRASSGTTSRHAMRAERIAKLRLRAAQFLRTANGVGRCGVRIASARRR